MRIFLCVLALSVISHFASAQFCCTKEGTMLFYNKHDASKGVTSVDSVKIIEVKNQSNALRVLYYNFTPENQKTYSEVSKCLDCELFVYHKSSKITDHYYMSEQLFKEAMIKQSNRRVSGKNSNQTKEKNTELDPIFKIKGDLKIPLSNKFTTGTPITDCQFNYKVGILNMKMGITKAKYLGIETIKTPAGTFRCQKISYQSKAKVMLLSGKADLTEWYAEGIGLVKREERNTKGKLQESFELMKIRN